MTIVMLQCEDETNLVLAVNTESKRLMAYCPKCRKAYEIISVEVNEDELARVMKSKRKLKEESPDLLFYLRCTELVSVLDTGGGCP